MKKAIKSQKRLRMALSGASGSGKTRSALEIAKYLGNRIGLIDTEYKSASVYADNVDFDVEEIVGNYDPARLIKALSEHGPNYDVLIIDSLTHFWNGTGGMLDMADIEVKKSLAKGGKEDRFGAWKNVTPVYNRVVQALLGCPAHLIVTIRAKQDYVRENGKLQKVGMAGEMRDGFSYELDVEGLLDQEHNLVIGKTRFESLDGKLFAKPGKEFAELLLKELESGAEFVPTFSTLAETPPAPVVPAVSEAEAQWTATLRAAKGKIDVLAQLRGEISTAHKNGTLAAEAFRRLGQVYAEVARG